MILFSDLEKITGGKIVSLYNNAAITSLITDSRKAIAGEGAIFFAIRGEHHDGHNFLRQLYELGIRNFVVEYKTEGLLANDCNILQVPSSRSALQAIAAHHRTSIHVPVIGITGSNGKTIIKEWLYQLLSDDYKIAKNPGSYNSQLGVPLSVWQLQSHHQLGIFEAGISRPGEMANLENIIKPTIGIFTTLGSAHDEGFTNRKEKAIEKIKLFQKSEVIIYCKDHTLIDEALSPTSIPRLSWGCSPDADIYIKLEKENYYTIHFKDLFFTLTLPFSDPASIENCFHCVVLMLYLQYDAAKIQEKIKALRSIPMRLELKEGINQCQLIDDTYNNDLAGLQISLEFLSNQHQKKEKRLILSDILESGLPNETLVEKIAALVSKHHIQHFIGIGPVLSRYKAHFSKAYFYPSTDEFLSHFNWNELQHEAILIKGARTFQFEKIVNKIQRKVHGTIMEIDLGAVVHNLNFFRAKLKPSTKIMVMVKAFGYGSGTTEIANILDYHKVDYLGVAYADEGIELRKNNIRLPIMVMNPSEESFEMMLNYNLEPEIYSFNILLHYLKFLNNRPGTIHIKLDTGMHRLGFEQKDIHELITILKENASLKIASIFSHLAGADEAKHDEFSNDQATLFIAMATMLTQSLAYKPLYHILNSPGILRLSHLQFDMVRLGIGLYGIDPTQEDVTTLKPVATLKTIISQVKKIKTGDTIGYGRRGRAERDLTLATIAIGYADGFNRAFSRGVGEVLVNGRSAKVIGNVCMDMTMIDITGIEAKEGDEVIIFGKDLSIQSLAKKINTIPYEILTNTSERVKRVFVAESI
jgi:alanine racemase